MKKFLSIVLVLATVLAFAACGKKAVEPTAALINIYNEIAKTISMDYEKFELSADDMIDYYGIESAKISELVAVQDACGYKDEIVMIKAVDEAAAQEIASLLNEHIDYQKESMQNYDAAQFEILGKSKVDVKGQYVAMFISSSQDKMLEIYNSYFA